MKKLTFLVSDEVKDQFTTAFEASGVKNQSEYFSTLVNGARPVEIGEKGKIETPLKRFQFLAIINGSIQRPILEAENKAKALDLFNEKWPKQTVHECNELK